MGNGAIERREAIKRTFRGIAGFGLVLALGESSRPAHAADSGRLVATHETPPLKITPRDPSEFNIAPLPESFTRTPVDSSMRWGSMTLSTVVSNSASPMFLDKPSPDGKYVTGWVFGGERVIQDGQVTIVGVTMPYHKKPLGFQHADPNNLGHIVTGIEVKDNKLVGLVKQGISGSNQYIPLDDIPDDLTEINFNVMLGDGGKTIGFFGLDGSLKSIIDIPSSTAEPGSTSLIVAWTSADSPGAVVNAAVLAEPIKE